MESHHSVTTHPQILASLADANSQYDLPNDWISRHFSAGGVPSPFIDPMTEQQVLDAMLGPNGRRRGPVAELEDTHVLAEGATARSYMAELSRKGLGAVDGRDYSRRGRRRDDGRPALQHLPQHERMGGRGPETHLPLATRTAWT